MLLVLRFALPLLFLLTVAVPALAQHQVLLDVARFRNDDVAIKGSVVEVYVTVLGKNLTYQRRGPKIFQAGATVLLEVVRPDGSATYQETITLKPPVLRDTSAALKNPVSFQKRINLPDGSYVLRAHMRDVYRATNVDIVEQPLVLNFASAKPILSDLVLLSKPASRSATEPNNFIRNGLSLTRAPQGMYARGMDKLYFYAELYYATAGQPLIYSYRLKPLHAAKGSKDAASGQGAIQGADGRPTVLTGTLDISTVPTGNYTLTLEIRNAKNQVFSTQTAPVRRNVADYAPAGATTPR